MNNDMNIEYTATINLYEIPSLLDDDLAQELVRHIDIAQCTSSFSFDMALYFIQQVIDFDDAAEIKHLKKMLKKALQD